MDAEVVPLAALSHSAAASMIGRLQELHLGSGRTLDESLTASMPELQAISDNAKRANLRQLFADAKTGREAGGVGAERRFDRSLAEIDAIDQGWQEAVRASFHRQLQDWVASGGSVLGPGGWIRVTVRPYQQGSVWWTDTERIALWCKTIARDVFTCIAADPRSRTGDTVGLAQLSEPTIGPTLDVSVMALLEDFQHQQRYDAVRYGVHPLQAKQAIDRIHAMRGPLLATCRTELLRLLREWDAQGRANAPE